MHVRLNQVKVVHRVDNLKYILDDLLFVDVA